MLLKDIFEKHGIGAKFMSPRGPVHTIIGTWEDGIICEARGEELYVTFEPQFDDYEVVL